MELPHRRVRPGKQPIEDDFVVFNASSRSTVDQNDSSTARETPPTSGRRGSYDYLYDGDRLNAISDDVSVGSEISNGSATAASDEHSVAAITCLQMQPDRRPTRKRHQQQSKFTGTINYHGATIFDAARQGNLPLCVLLWGMAASKRVNLMEPDPRGNNPMHFAAIADTPEVMGFLQQQGRALVSPPHTRLVDSKNDAGETPLLRAAATGKLPSLKYLLDEGADPFAVDNKGYTIFMLLAKNGHLWCLHYVYATLSDRVSPDQTFELLSALDNYGHNALDWAAEAGDVNIIEYLVRKGLEPTRLDSNQRSPLYWAARAGRVAAAQFLVRCGCDPLLEDNRGYCPYRVAAELKNDELVAALRLGKSWWSWSLMRLTVFGWRGLSSSKISRRADLMRMTISRPAMMRKGVVIVRRQGAAASTASPGSPLSSTLSAQGTGGVSASAEAHRALSDLLGVPIDTIEEGPILVGINGRGMKVPYALSTTHSSRFSYCFSYAFIVLCSWIFAIYVPYYVWLPFVLLVVSGYR